MKDLSKTNKRVKKILDMEAKRKREARNTQVKQYIEAKMQRGHSREAASKMAQGVYDSE